MNTNSSQRLIFATTGLIAAVICAPAIANEIAAPAQTTDTAKADDTVVIIRGVRGSVKDAADQKRKNKQISDSVSAEDAGKLPDNNVTEALAHVTGVQITRKHGEGSDMAIRGIQEVGTTINGNASGGGNLRSMNHNSENGAICTTAINFGVCQDQGPTLSDVPAALIKSVTVYKTRTADQIEGGTGGVVNVELRRPLDLRKGWTVAGSFNNSYSNIGNTSSPTASLLVAKRFDTSIGEMGFLVNLGFSKNNYVENHLVTETVMNFYDGTIAASGTTPASAACLHRFPTNGPCGTAASPYYVTAYRVWNGVQNGSNKRPTLNMAYQWRINDDLDVVLEGTALTSTDTTVNNYISIKTAGDGQPTYSNIVLEPDGKTIKSMTLSPKAGCANCNFIDLFSSYFQGKTNNYNTNGELHWHHDKWLINAGMQYTWTDTTSTNISQLVGVNGLNTAIVDFNNDAAKGVQVSLPGAAALNDPNNYFLTGLHNEVNQAHSRDFNGQVDATYRISDEGFLRSIQTGVRATSKFVNTYFAYRDAYGYDPATQKQRSVPLSLFPTGDHLAQTSLSTNGLGAGSFYHLDNQAVMANFADIVAYVAPCAVPTAASCTHPQYRSNTGDDWTTTTPTDKDNNSYSEKEFTQAWYGQFNYAFNAYFPVDGVIGTRIVHTVGEAISTNIRFAHDVTNPTTHVTTTIPETRDTSVGKGDFTDNLPSANVAIHFTDKLMLRGAYTYSVQRPSYSALAGTVRIFYDGNGQPTGGWGGNPDLLPEKGPSYDLSLEYYFGRGGNASFAAYVKKPEHQFFGAHSTNKTFPELGITTPIGFDSTYNGGQGNYQGYEFNVQGFFDFLPGIWHNFGGGVNYTYNQIFSLEYPNDVNDASAGFTKGPAPWTSKDTFNIQLYYDTPKFNARIAYNFRSKYQGDRNTDPNFTDYTYVNDDTSRLDASFAWTPRPYVTFTLEGTNLLNNNQVGYYGYQYFSAETRLQARTIQVGARFRY